MGDRSQSDADWAELSRNGFVILRAQYTAEAILDFQTVAAAAAARINRTVATTTPRQTLYKIFGNLVDYWETDGYTISEAAPGRHDGEIMPEDEQAVSPRGFASNPPPQLAALMRRALKRDYTWYGGLLTSTTRSSTGVWHRDVVSLFGDFRIDGSLPPYFFTVLVPTVPISVENGPTEIVLGSHRTQDDILERLKLTTDSEHDLGVFSELALCNVGDIIIMDGRCIHRGRANQSCGGRDVLYMVWNKIWYSAPWKQDELPLNSWQHAPGEELG
jgi:hypothetical protein